jgi:hypothetical protein
MIKNRSFGIRIVLAPMMALTVAVTGCKDDGGGGGTAGSGGTGGGGGTDLGCDEGRCVDDAQAAKCEQEIQACIAAEPANETTCIAFGNSVYCSEGGTGGAGGSGGVGGGGMGGEGGTGGGIDVSCDEGRCVDGDQATECRDAIAGCIAAEPANEERCIALGNLFFCNEGALSLVFVTSMEYEATVGDFLMDANRECAHLAQEADLPGGWAAWLSDDDTDAEGSIVDAKYVLRNGTVIANNMTELLDGNLDNPIQVDEDGNTATGDIEVWTGTNANGTNSGVNCNNWNSNSDQDTGQSGLANAKDEAWTNNQAEDCDVSNRLYCFGS